MRVKCKSGLEGWRNRLRKNYKNFEEFKEYSEMYGLHQRLGYRSPEAAWKANPVCEGSVKPSDFRKVSKKKVAGAIARLAEPYRTQAKAMYSRKPKKSLGNN